jgi:hypothetical protein
MTPSWVKTCHWIINILLQLHNCKINCCAGLNPFLFYCIRMRSGMEHPKVKLKYSCTMECPVLCRHNPVTNKTVEHTKWDVTSQPYNHCNEQPEQTWFDLSTQELWKQSMLHTKVLTHTTLVNCIIQFW